MSTFILNLFLIDIHRILVKVINQQDFMLLFNTITESASKEEG